MRNYLINFFVLLSSSHPSPFSCFFGGFFVCLFFSFGWLVWVGLFPCGFRRINILAEVGERMTGAVRPVLVVFAKHVKLVARRGIFLNWPVGIFFQSLFFLQTMSVRPLRFAVTDCQCSLTAQSQIEKHASRLQGKLEVIC